MRAPVGWDENNTVRCFYCSLEYGIQDVVQVFGKVVEFEAKGKCRRCNAWLQRNLNHGMSIERVQMLLGDIMTIIEKEKLLEDLDECPNCDGTGRVPIQSTILIPIDGNGPCN